MTEACKTNVEALIKGIVEEADKRGLSVEIDLDDAVSMNISKNELFDLASEIGFFKTDGSANILIRKPSRLEGLVAEFEGEGFDDMRIAGLDSSMQKLRYIDNAGLRVLTSPSLALASSPLQASRKAGELIANLGLTRVKNYDPRNRSQASIESRIKTLDKHRATIFNGLDRKGGVNGVRKAIKKLPEDAPEKAIIRSFGKSFADDLGVKRMSDDAVISRIIGTFYHSYGFIDETLSVPAKIREYIELKGTARLDGYSGDLQEGVNNLAKMLEQPIADSYKLLDDLANRIGVEDVKAKIATTYDPSKVDKNEEAFISVVKSELSNLRRLARSNKLPDNYKKDRKVYSVLTNDNIDKLAKRLQSEIVLRTHPAPITSIETRGIRIEGIDNAIEEIAFTPYHAGRIDSDDFWYSDLYKVTDIERLVESGVRRIGVDAELEKTFKSTNIKEIKKVIRASAFKQIDGTENQSRQKLLRKRLDDDLIHIDDSIRYLRGDLQRSPDHDSPVWKAERTALAVNNMRLMGGLFLGSLPEAFKIVMVQGLGQALEQGAKSFGRGVLRLPKSKIDLAVEQDLRSAAVGLDVELATTIRARTNMDEYIQSPSIYDDTLNKTTEKFFLATLVNHMNSTLKRISGRIALNNMVDTIFKIADGNVGRQLDENFDAYYANRSIEDKQADLEKYAKANDIDDLESVSEDAVRQYAKGSFLASNSNKFADKRHLAYLGKYGIDEESAKRIRDEIIWVRDTLGKEYDSNGVRVANMDYWRDDMWDIRTNLQGALRQITDDVILTPGLDRPLFFTKAGFRLITQFKSFAMSSFQKTSLLLGQELIVGGNRANNIIGATMMLATGTAYVMLRDKISSNEERREKNHFESPADFAKLLVRGGERSGLFASANSLYGVLNTATGGYIDPFYYYDDDLDKPEGVRAGRLANNVFGPTFGLGADTIGTIQNTASYLFSDDEFTDADKRRASRILPFQNFWNLRDGISEFTDYNLNFRDN